MSAASIPELIARLASAEANLQAALPQNVDAVLLGEGHTYLLADAQRALIASEARTKEQAGLLAALLASVPDHVAHVGVDGRIQFINRDVLHAGKETLLGTPWLAHLPEQHRVAAREAFEAVLATGADREFESAGQGVDGSLVHYSRRIGAVRRGDEIIGVVVVARDVTERDAHIRLAERQSQLEAANLELDAFAHSVSHDLQAPLRAISGFSTALVEDHGASLPPEGLKLIERIAKNAERMARLIADLLSFARVVRKAPQCRVVDMRALASSIVDDRRSQENGRAIDVRVGDLPPAPCDRALVHQVWDNLIGNAFKYTRGRTVSLVEISGHADGSENVYSVKDNGTGFDMSLYQRLFDPFQRLHSEAAFEGTGIGLSLARRIVERHGGRIWADATVDAGATFFFTLPRTRNDPDNGPHGSKKE